VPESDLSTKALLSAFGGAKGLFDSSVPITVFVVARFFVDTLNPAIVAAVAAGLVIVAIRKVRGESLQQAFSGFFGLLIAVLIARATGNGKDIFWVGIAITGLSGVAFGISLLAGKPAVALGLSALNPRYAVWPTHEKLRRACVISTAVWMTSFLIRAAVATTVVLTVSDSAKDNLLILIVINGVKWPLIVGSALLTVALVKKADVPPAA
jgi:hypothetical protein